MNNSVVRCCGSCASSRMAICGMVIPGGVSQNNTVPHGAFVNPDV